MPRVSAPLQTQFVAFLNEAWTPFHAVAVAVRMLSAAGYERLDEMGSWQAALRPGGKYYFTRNGSAIVAFAVGSSYQPGGGFNIIGAHTDSPCPKIKPLSKASAHGYLQVGVAPYGGGLWHTWFDRDLTVVGRGDWLGTLLPRLLTTPNGSQWLPTTLDSSLRLQTHAVVV